MVDPLREEPDKADRSQSPSLRVAVKSGAHCVALLGIVDQATTCVVRLVIIPILPATHSARIYSEVPQSGGNPHVTTRM
jgi:hypothetical protein